MSTINILFKSKSRQKDITFDQSQFRFLSDVFILYAHIINQLTGEPDRCRLIPTVITASIMNLGYTN